MQLPRLVHIWPESKCCGSVLQVHHSASQQADAAAYAWACVSKQVSAAAVDCKCVSMRTGGQKSKQEKKDAHKAKRRAKKGGDSCDAAALSKEAPTAEALAAVGANQMSQAAAERQAQIDKNRIAWQQRTQGTASNGSASAANASGPSPQPKDAASPRLHNDAGVAERIVDSAAESAESAEDDSSSSSSEEGEESAELDTTNGAQVLAFQHQ